MSKTHFSKLLYKRRTTADVLDESIDSIKRLEKLGLLDKVRFTPNGDVHHLVEQVHALASKGGQGE